MRAITAIAALGLWLCAANGQAQQHPLQSESVRYQPFSPRFDKLVEDRMSEWRTPGLAIAVIQDQKTWSKGYGYADLVDKVPVTPSTLFQGGSTTKAQIAALVAMLVQDIDRYKHITWQTKLHDINPERFQLSTEYESTELTLEDALSHRTGMPRHDFMTFNSNASVADQVRNLRHLPLSAPFRTKYQYCNLMYIAVLDAVQHVTQMPYEDLYASWLLKPLNMSETFSSTFDALACEHHNSECLYSQSYSWSTNHHGYREWHLDSLPPFIGATGAISNVNDYAKWVRFLMLEEGPLSKESHKAIRGPHFIASLDDELGLDGPQLYGFGLRSGTYRGHKVYMHNGGVGGYASKILFIPSLKWGVTVMQNAANSCLDGIAFHLLDDYLHTPIRERKDIDAGFKQDWEDLVKSVRSMPGRLFPSVAQPPMFPGARVEQYAGTYSHPAYGSITLVPGLPAEDTGSQTFHEQGPDLSNHMALHLRFKLLEMVYVFRHVSGENWLVEQREHGMLDDDVPSGYTKAKTDVGADGNVKAVYMIVEEAVTGDEKWAKFERVD